MIKTVAELKKAYELSLEIKKEKEVAERNRSLVREMLLCGASCFTLSAALSAGSYLLIW